MTRILANQSTALEHLARLVSFDSQNPPRAISIESDIFAYLQAQLCELDFKFEYFDAGDGCICLLATRGQPELLFNFHIDTVPASSGWSTDPFKLVVESKKATGLGACDIKGATACMLSAVKQSSGEIALLFSSDEEHGASAAVKSFLQSSYFQQAKAKFKAVVVAEPTQAKAVTAHRGIQSAKAQFYGEAGHASEKRAHTDNAIHKAAKWASAALEWFGQQQAMQDELSGIPFNIGKIEGGIKANMIAAECELSFGFRPLPGQDSTAILAQLAKIQSLSSAISPQEIEVVSGFKGPTLPAANQPFDKTLEQAERLAESLALPLGKAVSFWTEASLFSQAGLAAIVFGPGNIEQAHTADEWVSLVQLTQVENHYLQILNAQTPFNFSSEINKIEEIK